MDLESVAAKLWEAEENSTPIAPVREWLSTAEEAYAVQDINTARRLKNGGRLVGRKVGLTNLLVQKQLGVDQPDSGMLFADMEIMHDRVIPWNAAAQYKVEAEIAFVIGRDLSHENISMAELMRAVEYVVPSLEIVGSRIRDWDIAFADTIADNGSSALFSIGPSPRKLETIDFTGCRMELRHGEKLVSEGVGRDCFGSPLNAALWLARAMVKQGFPLKEGDVVLSGSLGPMVTAEPGARYCAHIDGLGETAVQFDT